jgi:transcriptional regulator with XRE-family HTH domain
VTGAQVKRIRQTLGLTQHQFAERLGVHPVTVAKWETDAQGIRGPAVRLMKMLAAAVTMADIPNAPAQPAKPRSDRARHRGKRKQT